MSCSMKEPKLSPDRFSATPAPERSQQRSLMIDIANQDDEDESPPPRSSIRQNYPSSESPERRPGSQSPAKVHQTRNKPLHQLVKRQNTVFDSQINIPPTPSQKSTATPLSPKSHKVIPDSEPNHLNINRSPFFKPFSPLSQNSDKFNSPVKLPPKSSYLTSAFESESSTPKFKLLAIPPSTFYNSGTNLFLSVMTHVV